MNLLADVISVVLVMAGCVFFLAGTVGLIRFPDFFTRLHAMTKADNVGLGFVVLGLTVQADSLTGLVQLLIIWILVLLASASSAQLLARSGLRRGLVPWRSRR